jgi:DNA helicase II / ATP-dependent DNA helicase PcrA
MPWDQDLDQSSSAYQIASSQSRFNRVIAGPGTGKSFALKRRVARLLEEGANPKRILPDVTFTNVAAEDLQREMLQIGVPGCENIRGSTLHSLCMRVLSRESVLQAVGRKPRPLNKYEIEPLLYDLSKDFGDKRARNKRIRAYAPVLKFSSRRPFAFSSVIRVGDHRRCSLREVLVDADGSEGWNGQNSPRCF